MRVGERVVKKTKYRYGMPMPRFREWMYRIFRYLCYGVLIGAFIRRGQLLEAILIGAILLDFASVHWRFTKVRDVLRAFIAMVEAMSKTKEDVNDG